MSTRAAKKRKTKKFNTLLGRSKIFLINLNNIKNAKFISIY